MSKKKLSQNEKIDQLISKSKFHAWCVVDTENEFAFNGYEFRIHNTVKQYAVKDKGISNEAEMDSILCIDDEDSIRFFDQNLKELNESVVDLL